MTPTFVTQSKLGEWFGFSPVAIGKVLIAEGLKDRFGATEKALLGGYAKEARTKAGLTFFVWDSNKVSVILDHGIGRTRPTPFIDGLVAKVGEAVIEAETQRAEGNDFIADLILEHAFEGVPLGMAGLIRGRLARAVAI